MAAPSERREADDDPRGAEPALRGSRAVERFHQRVADHGIEAVERRDVAARDPPDRRDARHPGLAVDEHRAAATLALRGAPVLDLVVAELVAERVEERAAPADGDVPAVAAEAGGRGRGRLGQLNELPQPQVWVAFGLVMWNPAPCRPSV